ncbi:hypothetical protein HDV05_006574, partial [Chytridiales sp. JEL 0842]
MPPTTTTRTLTAFHREMCLELLPPEYYNYNEAEFASTQCPSQTSDPSTCDGLIISARGLGLSNVLLTLVKIHTDPHNLVLLLNVSQREVESLKEELMAAAAEREDGTEEDESNRIDPNLLKVIDNATPASERTELYLGGGVLAVTSRILVVDMLTKVIPLNLIAGVFINHAHRVTEFSYEAFALTILRDSNKTAFIRAFSDSPELFTNSIWKLEKSMKYLFLRRVSFWPRFHVSVSSEIDSAGMIDLIEVRVPMSDAMIQIQAAIVECMESSLAEVKRTNRNVEIEDLTIENSLFRSFDTILRTQLEPIWHRISYKTKQIIDDMRTLRRLLDHLTSYDCVTFNSYLEALRVTNIPDTSSGILSESNTSPWLMFDSADTIFSLARKRVYIKQTPSADGEELLTSEIALNAMAPAGIWPVLEEQPKWRVLKGILKEIESERQELEQRGEDTGPVLIMVE